MSMAQSPSQLQQHSNKIPFTRLHQQSNNKFPSAKNNQVGAVMLYGVPIVSLIIDSQERLCLAQISNTLLKEFSYNEIHNRRVALGITCVQCTPVQLEILRRAGAMPVSSRRCGMITRREAERLCKSFLGDNSPPRLPDDFAFNVHHECAWGCNGSFLPSRYNSSRAKCIKCCICGLFFSPNKFIFHSHRTCPTDKYIQPDAANFNSWRRHMKLSGHPPEQVIHAWEDVKAMFNGGTRKRMLSNAAAVSSSSTPKKCPNILKGLKSQSGQCEQKIPLPMISASPKVSGSLPFVMDYVWQQGALKATHLSSAYQQFPWFTHSAKFEFGLPNTGSPFFFPKHNEEGHLYQSAFRPVYPATMHHYKQSEIVEENRRIIKETGSSSNGDDEDETVDIETCNEEVDGKLISSWVKKDCDEIKNK